MCRHGDQGKGTQFYLGWLPLKHLGRSLGKAKHNMTLVTGKSSSHFLRGCCSLGSLGNSLREFSRSMFIKACPWDQHQWKGGEEKVSCDAGPRAVSADRMRCSGEGRCLQSRPKQGWEGQNLIPPHRSIIGCELPKRWCELGWHSSPQLQHPWRAWGLKSYSWLHSHRMGQCSSLNKSCP